MRKQAEVSSLENRIQLLEKTVEGMSHEFIGFGSRLLSSDLSERPHILGDLGVTTRKFLDLAKVIDRDNDDERNASNSSSVPDPGLTSLSGFVPSFATGIPTSFAQSYRSSTHDETSPTRPQGGFSPRLSYGLPSSEVLPQRFLTEYFVGGVATFSTKLYLNTLDTVFKALSGDMYIPGFIPSVCRYRLRHQPRHIFMELIRGRLEMMKIEYETVHNIAGNDRSAWDPELATSLLLPSEFEQLRPVMISSMTDLVREGESPDDWLDPWNTQQYLKSQWQLAVTSTSVSVPSHILHPVQVGQGASTVLDFPTVEESSTAMSYAMGLSHHKTSLDWYQHQLGSIPTDAVPRTFSQPPPVSTPDIVTDVKPLMQRLVLESICFGNGPRFPRHKLDAVVRSFLDHTLVSGKYEFLESR
jgi:hypothetical protein